MAVTAPTHRPLLDRARLGDFWVGEVLYEAEEPIVFTVMVSESQTLLAFLTDHDAHRWLILAPCNAKTLQGLRDGSLPVRDALTASWTWLAQMGPGDQPERVWEIEAGDVPEEHWPAPGVPLLPEHEPLLIVRAIGPNIVPGDIPASVVAFVASATRQAVKVLLDFFSDRPAEGGRPPDASRAIYDLPISRFAFGSFELSFSAPRDLFAHEELTRVAELLQRGLAWAAGENEDPFQSTSDEEREAVLRAVLGLTPPAAGPIEEMSLGGQWMTGGTTLLKRGARPRVRNELRSLKTERIVRREGRVGEFDVDRQSFILRDTGDSDVRCSYREEDYDDVVAAVLSQGHVVVVGVERGGRLYVGGIKPQSSAA